MGKWAIPIFSIFGWISLPLAAEQQACNPAVAELVSAQGSVETERPLRAGWQPTSLNAPYCVDDRVRTGPLSRAVLNMMGDLQTYLSLNQNTLVRFISQAGQVLLSVDYGQTHVRSHTPRHFDVTTPFVNAGIEGTEFLVSANGEGAEITVFEGKVKLSNALGSLNLAKGETGVAMAGQAPRIKLLLKPENAVQWALYYPPVIDANGLLRTTRSAVLREALRQYLAGHITEALKALEQASDGEKATNDLLTAKSGLLLTVGRVDEAESLIWQALGKRPRDGTALSLQTVIALARNQPARALELARQAIAAEPEMPVPLLALSYAEQARFKLEDALRAVDAALKLDPENGLAYARQAELLASTGEIAKARAAAERSAQLNPNLGRAQTVLGFTQLMESDAAQARQSFQSALRLNSFDPLAHFGMGLAKIRQGMLDEGTADLEVAGSLDPNDSLIRSYLGKAYYEQKRSSVAEIQFDLAKLYDPKDPTPHFYDAIKKQTENRPVEALNDMQQAIELNDNRAIYRSKLMLDKDVAARQVGLGRIYTNLGFDDVANRSAMKSLAIDPTNYSAHRLLSDSYSLEPRADLVRASEYLQAQLFQPINYNPVPPSLGYAKLSMLRGIGPNNIAFNEYNRLFERNGARFSATGIVGSNNTLGDEASLSALYNNFSVSFGQLHYNSNGYRLNNDLAHNIYNAFAQWQISPQLNMQVEYRHRETRQGALDLAGFVNNFDVTKRRRLEQDSYRYGLKFSPTAQSDFLLSFIHTKRQESNFFYGGRFVTDLDKGSNDLETQYIFHGDVVNLIAGGGIYLNDNFRNSTNRSPIICGTTSICKSQDNFDVEQYFGYAYTSFKALDALSITGGLSYDNYRNVDPKASAKISELNPKFGLVWQADKNLSLRAAAFKVVKSAIVDNHTLQPSQIAGFKQWFDDFNGTVSWLYGIGADGHIHDNIYAGAEAYRRDVNVPAGIDDVYDKYGEELYRFYFNWAPLSELAVNTEFRFENFRHKQAMYPKVIETFYVPLEFRFFDSSGVFAALKGTYINQNMKDPDRAFGGTFRSQFYLVDAAVGYRLPRQIGLISFEAKNLFDTPFTYRDRNFQTNEERVSEFAPERQVFGKLTLNF